jgi:putative inorganic carbon (HCO3(-)) transporter
MSNRFPLARAYRGLSLYGQLAIASCVLTACLLAPWPALSAAVAVLLMGLFALNWQPGLYLSVLAIPFASAYKQVGPALTSPAEVLVVATFAGWALAYAAGILTRRRANGGTRALFRIRTATADLSALDWSALFFVAISLISSLVIEAPIQGEKDIPAALTKLLSSGWELRLLVVEPFLLYLLVRNGKLDRAALLRLGSALVLAGLTASLIGLYCYFILDYVERAEGVNRLLSIFYDSPNHISLFLGRVVPVAVSVAAFASTPHRRIFHGIALIPMLLCIYLTYSRGAWLVGLPAALLFIGLMRGRRATALAVGVLALVALALLPVAGTTRFASVLNTQGGTSFLRLLLWRGVLRMIAAHPLWGVGLGSFQAEYAHYMLPEAWREPVLYHAHNIVLDYWSMLGIPGIAALVWLQAAFWRDSLHLYRRLSDRDVQVLVLGLMASMINFLAHGLVDTAYFLADLALVFMLTLGITRALMMCLADTLQT